MHRLARIFAISTVLFTLIAPLSNLAHAKSKESSGSSGGNTFNIRFSPLPLIIGYVNVDADVRIGDQFVIGPTFSYWNITLANTSSVDSVSLKITKFGVRGGWHPDGAYQDGWYVSPYAGYIAEEVSATSGTLTGSAKVSTFSLAAVAGYHWFWDSFNMNLGAGFEAVMMPGTTKVTFSNGTSQDIDTRTITGLTIDYMIGWAF